MYIIVYKGEAMPPLPSLSAVGRRLALLGIHTVGQAVRLGYRVQIKRVGAL